MVLNFRSLSLPLYWLIPPPLTNPGLGANFQMKKHWKMEGFSTSKTRRAGDELNVCFLHSGEGFFSLICDLLPTGTLFFCFLQGALNVRIPSLTGTMRKMGNSTVTRTTGGSLGNLAMAALC